MKLYDISQEVFACTVYPGDRGPERLEELRMARGDDYNLTSFAMGAHNGTHVDAPFHFFAEGATVEAIPLEKTVGPCLVRAVSGRLGGAEAAALLREAGVGGRLLLKGSAEVTAEAAEVFRGLWLIGVESQSVGAEEELAAVHRALLGAGVVLLEGLRLSQVPEGRYLLSAAPLALGGADGAPCRAVLLEC